MRRDGDQAEADPRRDRIVAPSADHPGATHIFRGGRCFMAPGVGPEVTARLERFARALIEGDEMPSYGRRWVLPEPEPRPPMVPPG